MAELNNLVPQEEKKTMYNMEMHTSIVLDEGKLSFMRVPGGWIYEFNNHGAFSYVFVPKPVFKNKSNKPNKDAAADKELEAFLQGNIPEDSKTE